jgi:DNA (cytosine-5)-methyltransferase 1
MKQPQLTIGFDQYGTDWHAETLRIIEWIRETGVMMVYIDLFCGFGGTTTGVQKARHNDSQVAIVILGINHDDIALACHRVHNPRTLHLREDVRDVKLKPISEMVEAIRKEFPWIAVVLWISAECQGHSKANGGNSRDGDSRSLPEELHRYEKAIKPNLIQVENVTEFRIWGPLQQKVFEPSTINFKEFIHKRKTEYGTLYSKNKKLWVSKKGLAFTKTKEEGMRPWMVPIKEKKAEFFDKWKQKLISRDYNYDDKDINAANLGAFTSRLRYYGQLTRDLPILWPQQTHTKDPDKYFAQTGIQLQKHNPVREVLDFNDKGPSLFVPERIESDQTFRRVNEGGIKFIAGGKEAYQLDKEQYEKWLSSAATESSKDGFLIKYNSSKPAEDDYKNTVVGFDQVCPTLPCRNMIGKVHPEFITKHFSGHPESKSYSVDQAAATVKNKDSQTLNSVQFLPFILQFNNNTNLNSIEDVMKTLTQKDKFYSLNFIQQRHNGNPSSRVYSTGSSARTVTSTGGNQELVQVEKILPFLCNYHGNGHNCHSIEEAGPAALAADVHAMMTPEPFIFRQFSNGGETKSVNDAAGSIPTVPKMNIISPEWIMDTSFKNVGQSVDQPSKAVLASRHHSYIVNPSYGGHSSSIDKPSPVVVARQDKAPLHLAQVEFGDQTFYGIVIYNTDSPEMRELKYFMAIYGIIDIKMRMLKEEELLPIQGFPKDHIHKVRAMGIKVSSTNAKKYIGNSQEVNTAKKLAESYAPFLFILKEKYMKEEAA